jgi:ferredoxin-NADP reductase
MSTTVTSPTFMSKLNSRQEVAEGTMTFRFDKPASWAFKPGQFVDMTLLDPLEMDSEGNTRTFSIASAPHEETLMVATRMRDTAFKRVLRAMPLGTTVKIEGPFGNLILQNAAARAAVFLAGGIGITPFRSMLFHVAHATLSHRIFLFYSNRRPEDAPFLDELQALEGTNPNYTLIATMTEMETSHRSWHGETGLISKEILSRYLKDALSPIYYIAGPPGMVKGLQTMLTEIGVNDPDIRTEEFAGY